MKSQFICNINDTEREIKYELKIKEHNTPFDSSINIVAHIASTPSIIVDSEKLCNKISFIRKCEKLIVSKQLFVEAEEKITNYLIHLEEEKEVEAFINKFNKE